MYGMILIFIQLPWVVLKGKNYSIYAAYFRIKAKGIKALSEMAASDWDGNLTIIRIQLILLIVFQIVIVLHIVTQWLHKEYYLNIAALVVLGVYIVVNESGFGMLVDNSTKTILISAIIMRCQGISRNICGKGTGRKRRRAQEIIFSGKLYQTFLSDGLAQF